MFPVLVFGFTRPSQDLGSVLVNGHKPLFYFNLVSCPYTTGSLNCALVLNSLLDSDLDL